MLMVSTDFTLVSGTYGSEQDLLLELSYFMTQLIDGWTEIKIVDDAYATNVNIAFFSDGSQVGIYDRFYVRAQGISDSLRFNVLSGFDASTDTDHDAIGGTGNETELLTGTSSGTYWFIGNADAIHVVVDSVGDGTLHGGFGHWLTYYSRPEDPKPFYVFGQTAQSQTFAGALRLESYGPRSWGNSMSATDSGSGAAYEAPHPVEIANGSPNPRSGQPKLIEPVFYTDVTFPSYEIRGEVPGLYMCGGEPYNHGNVVTVTGTPGTTTGDYYIHKHTNDLTWAVGPITTTTSGSTPDLLPELVASGIVCHLQADAGVTASFTVSGTVSLWADQSGSGNDWTQTTEANKPFLFENIHAGLPAILFDGTDDLLTSSAFISGSNPGEIFIVLQNTRPAATNDGLWWFGSETLNSHYTFEGDAIFDSFGTTVRKSAGVSPISPRDWHVYSVRSDSGDWANYQNLALVFSTASNTVGWTSTFKLGESTAQSWGGYIGEVVVYNRVLTHAERTRTLGFLIDRWVI